jgi:ribose transport system permease protein
LLAGGAVAVLGTFIGTMLTLVIRQGLSVQGIGLETLNIALGLVLLAALSVGQIQKMFTSFKLRAKK